MDAQLQFVALIDADLPTPADALVLLEGDGYARLPCAVELFERDFAPIIVISGGLSNPSQGSIAASILAEELQKQGISPETIILEEESTNTYEQAEHIFRIAQEKKWRRIILIASHYHQYRAFLTFLHVRQELGYALEIINVPARNLSWFEETGWGRRIDLFAAEFEKIVTYQEKRHVASYEDAIVYFKQKDIIK